MSQIKDYLDYVKTTFRLSSYQPSKIYYRTYFLKYVSTPIMFVLILFVIYKLKDMHDNIFEIATVFESLSTHGHVFGRKLIILKHAKLIEELIDDRKYFWKYDALGAKYVKLFSKKMLFREIIIKSLTGMSVLMVLYFYLTPIFVESVKLPQATWTPSDSKFGIGVMYFLQILCITESIPVAIIVDGTLLLMSGEMEIQFFLLKKKLELVQIGSTHKENETKCLKELIKLTKYHSFLLRVHKKMTKVFSEFFLLQFLISIEGLCIEIFVVNKAETWDHLALGFIYITGIIMQSSFTFMSASNLEIEAETLPDHIFAIDWYNAKNLQITKHLQFMILRSQQRLSFTGAGLFDVNRNMFLQIMRTGFSISALIRRI